MVDRDTIQTARASTRFEDFRAALAGVDPDAIPGRYVAGLARTLAGFDRDPDATIGYLGNVTLDLLAPFVDVRAACAGLLTHGYVAPFDQHVQEILREDSELRRRDPDLVLLYLSLAALEPELVHGFAALAEDDRAAARARVLDDVEGWARGALERLSGTLVLTNFPRPTAPAAGTADLNAGGGETEFYYELNLELIRRFRADARIQVLDLERLLLAAGAARAHDPKMYFVAKMPWSETFLPELAREVVRFLRAAKGLAKKVLVCDLDNTLWGGVAGEDGPHGVKVGPGDPAGEAFLAFQRRVKALKDSGVVLAACSKNNPEDALAVFEARPEMPLQPSDFAVMELNWDPKHVNLQRIADALNVGTDSLVFVDDNPAETALVASALPEVTTVLLPRDPAAFAGVLDRLAVFDKLEILADDRAKAAQYAQKREREEHRGHFEDLGAYLESLAIEVALRPARPEDLARVHQLFTKTNQFNLTTIRYSMGDVERFHESGAHDLLVAAAKDRFGDLGTIALALVEREDKGARIDSFVMSCRAMGRGIETAFVNYLKARHGALRARFVPTAKNAPARTFFEDQGFAVEHEAEDGTKDYTLAAGAAPLPCGWLRVTEE